MKIDKQNDKYTVASTKMLGQNLKSKINKCMVTTLSHAELVWGNKTDEYKRFRRMVLKVHNETMRHIENELDGYNIERITHTISMPVLDNGSEQLLERKGE